MLAAFLSCPIVTWPRGCRYCSLRKTNQVIVTHQSIHHYSLNRNWIASSSEQRPHVQWYPGHIAKAERLLKVCKSSPMHKYRRAFLGKTQTCRCCFGS